MSTDLHSSAQRPHGRDRAASGSTFAGDGRPAAGPGSRFSPAAAFAAALAALAFAAILYAWLRGGGSIDLPWAPALGLRLHFRLDALGALYALLATGIGAAVFLYSGPYLRLHLAHQGRPARDERSFYALMLLFAGSMVGLATAQDLVLLFVFWDLTAIASYFLIGFDRHEAASRSGALMALLVTGITAVLLLIGSVTLYVAYGTFSLPDIIAAARPGTALTVAAALIAVAGLAKSAQVPFHFWLPNAMVAPTPVSAYLHSAAMVAAGVLLIGRTYPLLAQSELVLDGMLVVGLASMLAGGLIALTRERLKQVLAYSTVAQYGYMVALYGVGGPAGAVGGAFFVAAHALAKSALFLVSGAVTQASDGEERLGRLGGRWRTMPLVAGGGALAAAALAGLPLTVGFFKDELLFKAALERGPVVTALVVAGPVLTFAYIGRFWGRIFLGRPREAPTGPRSLPATLVAPIAVLALLSLAFGLWISPLESLAGAAGAVSLAGEPAGISLAYYLDARATNLIALGVYALGGLLLASYRHWVPVAQGFALVALRFGPERAYFSSLRQANRLSSALHRIEVRDLRRRVAWVLVPCGVLVAGGLVATPTLGQYAVGELDGGDAPLVILLALAAAAALAATAPRSQLVLVLVLSGSGYSLAAVFALFGAPDVALVAVLVETLFALLFVAVFSLLPDEVLRREQSLSAPPSRRWRDPLVGVVSGLFALAVVWGTLSSPVPSGQRVAERLVDLAPAAHAKDVVTAVLSDFRALDTLAEVTVLVIALAGVAGALTRRRPE
ncbi:MAG TPA: hydrogen gas-evolving membrane-bound hydrogenase subunit E [Thermoleophilaceae bacterium]|nr:hydrogen gas-evolving membrane-bound hydrogenase subunit E [Thermoleophilaceae bacterium]